MKLSELIEALQSIKSRYGWITEAEANELNIEQLVDFCVYDPEVEYIAQIDGIVFTCSIDSYEINSSIDSKQITVDLHPDEVLKTEVYAPKVKSTLVFELNGGDYIYWSKFGEADVNMIIVDYDEARENKEYVAEKVQEILDSELPQDKKLYYIQEVVTAT